jgi:fatty-acyl-CoA synthase
MNAVHDRYTDDFSYVRGRTDVSLINDTIGNYFDHIAERYAEREALIVRHQQVRWTWRELKSRVDTLAAGLRRLGLYPGERIGIWSQNNAEWTLMQFATAKLGLILVNINPAYRLGELEHALNLVQCRALVLAPSFKSSDYLAILNELIPELKDCEPGHLVAERAPFLEIVIRLGDERTPGMMNLSDLLRSPTEAELQTLAKIGTELDCNDPINIQFTSGTTGAPKGATLTHRNILNNGQFVGVALAFTERDRLCIPVPLYHCFAMVVGNLACLTHGATMVYPDEGFSAASVLDTIQAERCTAVHGVPTMFIAILECPDFSRYDLSSLRTGAMGGAPCPMPVMRQVMDRMHMRDVTIVYGMTETSPVSFQSASDDPVDKRVTTVGRVQPHLEVKIIDAEGNVTPRGTAGELLTRGYSVMQGYWGDEQRTRESIDDGGWMHSGDLAAIDSEGYCQIVGRVKDMVIRGGENIFPREVEEYLYKHPKIMDVQCVGVPDQRLGEELCACIILRAGVEATAEEIRTFCRGQIAHYKVPRYVHFLDSFPLTITGKIRKNVLREQMAEIFRS